MTSFSSAAKLRASRKKLVTLMSRSPNRLGHGAALVDSFLECLKERVMAKGSVDWLLEN